MYVSNTHCIAFNTFLDITIYDDYHTVHLLPKSLRVGGTMMDLMSSNPEGMGESIQHV